LVLFFKIEHLPSRSQLGQKSIHPFRIFSKTVGRKSAARSAPSSRRSRYTVERKDFFFEKKKQKTFVYCGRQRSPIGKFGGA
jgi:hypothetical protein